MICFISGGITGIPEYKENFRRAALQLKELGFIPLDPAAMTLPLSQDGVWLPDEKWLEIDFAALRQCSAVYHLTGWEKSDGSRKEHAYALAYGIPFLYQEEYSVYRLASVSPEALIDAVSSGRLETVLAEKAGRSQNAS